MPMIDYLNKKILGHVCAPLRFLTPFPPRSSRLCWNSTCLS